MEIQWVEIEKIKPNPKNPNQHSEEQVERLVKLIKYQGWRHPIIVSNRSQLVVAGHGRLQAAKKMGLTKVPIHYQDFQDDEQEYAFLVSDNAIASWAELDLANINTELPALGPDFEIDLLGIRDFLLEPAEKALNPEEHWTQLPEFQGPDAPLKIIIICKDEDSRAAFIEKFNLKIMKRLSGNLIWSVHWPQE